MRLRLQKRQVFISLGVIYLTFTTVALLYILSASYLNSLSLNSYNAGRKDSVDEFIEGVNTDNGCQPVPIYSGDKAVNVINVDCLEVQGEKKS
ncbi:hypothetical protein KC660_01240 [Candidatus Dojkabacteria bacterium]|uniref:Uncharacterized protein n=1 Tax=Candidatus Dojkabacteria bacterium TaxID=2099670 RepID=A0A955L331_9BACT|nr:hypothetical protein [Candidatus Dojkabacteria bacterium]